MTDVSGETSHPAYGRVKQWRRNLLRRVGRWPREHYDVRIVYENGRAAYKKVIFRTEAEACRVSDTLRDFGATPHLPTWRRREQNMVWVDFVSGRCCRDIDDSQLAPLAECFGHFASQQSRMAALETTPFWRQHSLNLECLRTQNLIGRHLHRRLNEHSERVAPRRIRLGFDYTDPIGANLVQRDDCGRICAIDIKNLHAETLVGQGLAKASARWLSPPRRERFFAELKTRGLEDLEQSFEFLCVFEKVQRMARKTRRDLRTFNRVRTSNDKNRKLSDLLR